MRTVSQLSKLTGINRRTIQYYASEKLPGRSGKGAGILSPCMVGENGYRYFNDEALFELLAIKTLRQCGYEPKAIRHLLNSEDFDLAESAEMQLKAIERAKHELEQQEQFVNIIKLLGTADYENDEEMTVVFMSLLMKMLFISIEQVIRESKPDYKPDFDKEQLLDAVGQQQGEQAAHIAEACIKMVGHAENGEMDLAVEAIPEEVRIAIREESKVDGDEVGDAIDILMKLYNAGESPQSRKAQHCAAIIFQASCPRRRLAELEGFTKLVGKLMEGTYVAILAELIAGEGFADFVSNTVEAYFSRAKASVKKKGQARGRRKGMIEH